MGHCFLDLSWLVVLPHWIVSFACLCCSAKRKLILCLAALVVHLASQIHTAMGDAQQAHRVLMLLWSSPWEYSAIKWRRYYFRASKLHYCTKIPNVQSFL
jgi:hypothetical protein